MSGLIRFIKEEVIGSENTFLAWSILGAVLIIMGFGVYINSPDASFHGVAGSREFNVNFEHPVEIRSVHVLPGQRVKKGDILIELDQSQLTTQIRTLAAQIAKLKAERSVRDQMNKAVGNNSESFSGDPLVVELKQLEDERAHLEVERNNLYVFAEIDGIVGSVNFKKGERAPAFAALVTVSPDSPTFVQGFIYEELRTNVQPGSRVKITSLTNTGASVQGKVLSVGARFVEMPTRLAPRGTGSSSGIWGREVTVEIPKHSDIILGEKVQISPSHSIFSFLANAEAEENVIRENSALVKKISVPSALAKRSSFEPSGAIYLADLKKYLVVSDDTDENDSPWLFFMSADGEVEEAPVEIPGLREIQDMESISADQNYVYVMSSLSPTKNGKARPSRNLLVRMKRKGREFSETQSIPFGKILRKLISESGHPLLKGLESEGLDHLEIEAQTVRDGALYLGLKAPPYPNGTSALMLKISNVDALFAGKATADDLEVWKSVRLDTKDNSIQRLTDFSFVGNTLYFTTSCKGESCGAVWKLGENESRPQLLQTYDDVIPEGLAYDEQKNSFLVTFDMGNDAAKFTTFTGPRSAGQ